ncbi:hypothetical protein [Methylobacterium tarhaniae]|uniref:hypothetical protein n=1 Tax=Methylobacterium tarhaniae TaxID=1187852 RepID=UPI003D06D126
MGLTKTGRAKSKREAADAIHAGLNDALRWHIELGQPLLLLQHEKGLDPRLDWRRGPLRRVVGQDVPWPDGWGSDNPVSYPVS